MFSMLLPGDVTMVRRRMQTPTSRVTIRTTNLPPQERIEGALPNVIILSGGPNSVHLEGAPRVPDGFFEFCKAKSIPVLGICYGMQVIICTSSNTLVQCMHAVDEHATFAWRSTGWCMQILQQTCG